MDVPAIFWLVGLLHGGQVILVPPKVKDIRRDENDKLSIVGYAMSS